MSRIIPQMNKTNNKLPKWLDEKAIVKAGREELAQKNETIQKVSSREAKIVVVSYICQKCNDILYADHKDILAQANMNARSGDPNKAPICMTCGDELQPHKTIAKMDNEPSIRYADQTFKQTDLAKEGSDKGTTNSFVDRHLQYRAVDSLATYGRKLGMMVGRARYLRSARTQQAGQEYSTLNNFECELEWQITPKLKRRVTATISYDPEGKFIMPRVFKTAEGKEYSFEKDTIKKLTTDVQFKNTSEPSMKKTDQIQFRKPDPSNFKAVASLNETAVDNEAIVERLTSESKKKVPEKYLDKNAELGETYQAPQPAQFTPPGVSTSPNQPAQFQPNTKVVNNLDGKIYNVTENDPIKGITVTDPTTNQVSVVPAQDAATNLKPALKTSAVDMPPPQPAAEVRPDTSTQTGNYNYGNGISATVDTISNVITVTIPEGVGGLQQTMDKAGMVARFAYAKYLGNKTNVDLVSAIARTGVKRVDGKPVQAQGNGNLLVTFSLSARTSSIDSSDVSTSDGMAEQLTTKALKNDSNVKVAIKDEVASLTSKAGTHLKCPDCGYEGKDEEFFPNQEVFLNGFDWKKEELRRCPKCSSPFSKNLGDPVEIGSYTEKPEGIPIDSQEPDIFHGSSKTAMNDIDRVTKEKSEDDDNIAEKLTESSMSKNSDNDAQGTMCALLEGRGYTQINTVPDTENDGITVIMHNRDTDEYAHVNSNGKIDYLPKLSAKKYPPSMLRKIAMLQESRKNWQELRKEIQIGKPKQKVDPDNDFSRQTTAAKALGFDPYKGKADKKGRDSKTLLPMGETGEIEVGMTEFPKDEDHDSHLVRGPLDKPTGYNIPFKEMDENQVKGREHFHNEDKLPIHNMRREELKSYVKGEGDKDKDGKKNYGLNDDEERALRDTIGMKETESPFVKRGADEPVAPKALPIKYNPDAKKAPASDAYKEPDVIPGLSGDAQVAMEELQKLDAELNSLKEELKSQLKPYEEGMATVKKVMDPKMAEVTEKARTYIDLAFNEISTTEEAVFHFKDKIVTAYPEETAVGTPATVPQILEEAKGISAELAEAVQKLRAIVENKNTSMVIRRFLTEFPISKGHEKKLGAIDEHGQSQDSEEQLIDAPSALQQFVDSLRDFIVSLKQSNLRLFQA